MLKKGLKKRLFSIMATTTMFTASFFTVNSNAASYYIRTVFDEGSFGLITQIVTDSSTEAKESLERQKGVNFSSILDYRKVHKGSGNDAVPGSSLIANIVLNDAEKVNETYDTFLNGDDDALNKGLVFTFPGLNNSIDTSVKYVGTSADAARAELVGNTLTKGLNDALAFIKTYSGTQHIGGDGLRHVVAQLARITSQFPERVKIGFNTGSSAGSKGFTVHYIYGNQKTLQIGGKNINLKEDLIPINGLDYSDYAVISTTDNRTGDVVYGYFPWRMEKGYYEKQKMADYVGSEYTKIAKSKENKYVTWGQLAMQAGVNADLRDTTSVDSAKDTMTLIGQGLGADLTSTINSVRSLLNLAPIQELILNMGSRNATHHYGVMTQDMYNTAKTVYAFVLAVSLLFLGALIVRMIHHKMISTTNIIAKTSLMEGLQDIMFVGVMLALFPGIFEILLELNYHIVNIFSYSSSYLQAYGITGAKVLGMESLAGFMVSSIYLSIDAYINTTYLVRAIVVSFLFAISPIMTISYAWGPMQKKLYFSYFRELVGNIFMQSFHAITMTFFAGYNATNMSAMEAIASAYCFIPITQLFRSLVIGSQGGFSEQLGGKLAGQLVNTGTNMHRASVAKRQSEELNNLNAKNSAWSSGANALAQIAGGTANIIGSNVQENLNMGELANSATRAIAGTTGNAKGKQSGGGIKGALKSATINAGGVALGSAVTGFAESNARKNLGEMQMKHSMENIGVGLAQAGMGIGVSSYDAGAGSGMVSAGMGSVEKAAGTYGQGQSNAGAGGIMYGLGAAAQTAGQLGSQSMYGMHKQNSKDRRRAYEDRMKVIENQEIQSQKETDRGLDTDKGSYNKTADYIGMRSANKGGFSVNAPAPITKIEAHQDNTNNATVVVDSTSKNAHAEDSMMNYAKVVQDYHKEHRRVDMNASEIQSALQKAHADYGVSQTVAPNVLKNGEVAMVLEDVSNRLGLEIDKAGKTYASSKALKDTWQKQ